MFLNEIDYYLSGGGGWRKNKVERGIEWETMCSINWSERYLAFCYMFSHLFTYVFEYICNAYFAYL